MKQLFTKQNLYRDRTGEKQNESGRYNIYSDVQGYPGERNEHRRGEGPSQVGGWHAGLIPIKKFGVVNRV